MITLSANTETYVPLTLFEKTTISGATYVMNLYSKNNQDNIYFWLTGDTTNNNARYNYFPVTVNLDEGQYNYMVYQSSASTATTIVTSALTVNNVVESGFCRVLGSGTTTNIVYNPTKNNYTYLN
jgi:hypothetical protein